MERDLTADEFRGIYNNLFYLSDGWADLWLALYITKIPPKLILKIKHEDICDEYLYIKGSSRFKSQRIKICTRMRKLIELRAKRYPNDIYIFQSHSNFNKFTPSHLTLIAFNRALKIASKNVTSKTVSSKSAYVKQRI